MLCALRVCVFVYATCGLLVVLGGCSWDLSQPPRDNSPALRLYRHSQSVTGVAQITDERLISGSMDGTVRARVLEGCARVLEGVEGC